MKERRLRTVRRGGLIALLLAIGVCTLLFGGAVVRVSSHAVQAEKNETPLLRIEDVPNDWWAALAKRKVLFVHREIGDEIIEGMECVIGAHEDIRLHIAEGTEPSMFEEPVLAHVKLGRCREPESKLEGLKQVLHAGVGEKVDIVLVKFCWADVLWESDAVTTFRVYQRTIDELEAEYPRVTFVHVTVPLVGKPRTWRAITRESVKLLVGRPSHFDDDLRSKQYDDLLRVTYSRDHIFDLAFVEAVSPDDLVCSTSVRGVDHVLVRAPQYPRASSHYSKEEQEKIGEQLLICLARVAADR